MRQKEGKKRKEERKPEQEKRKTDRDKAVQRQKKKRQIGLLYGAALDSLMFGEF